MAHGFLQSFDAALTVCSAGTEASGKVNPLAIKVMLDAGIDISDHTSDAVSKYINETWDFVITVCGGANEACPAFTGQVRNRLHMGFEDPSEVEGSEAFVWNAFVDIRDKIHRRFLEFYNHNIK